MYDLLTEPLPTEWNGRRIDPDFRHIVRLINALRRSGNDEETGQIMVQSVRQFFLEPVTPDDLVEAVCSMMEFAKGGTDEETAKAQKDASDAGTWELALDYHYDADYLAGAFQQAYHIDLTSDKVHWWRFKALLHALPSETPLGRIMDYRSADTSEMDAATRQRYEEAKMRYALPDELKGAKRTETLQEHEKAFFDRF